MPSSCQSFSRPSLWRPSPTRFARLILGLAIFGVGEGLLVVAELGNSPWTVLAEGVSLNSPLGVGAATIVVSFVVLLLWIPLRQRLGLGTIMNAIVIGLAIEIPILALPDELAIGVRWAAMIGGIALVALGSGLYLTAALGPGPRDGLMTGISLRSGASLRLVRASIEISVLVAGFLLGGTVGLGTVAFAIAIGPGVQLAVERLSTPEWRALMTWRERASAPSDQAFLDSPP